MSDNVLVSVEEGIATLTLNRPERLNAWHTPMREAVAEALGAMNRDASVGAIVLTGAGERAFSAGQDLEETMAFESGEAGREWFLSWRAFYDSLRCLDKGCVAALNGVAAGSAFQFAMLADVRVGHPGTRMGQPEINSGIPSVLGPMLMHSPARPLAHRRAHVDRPHDGRRGVSPHRSDPPPRRARPGDVQGA